MDNKQIKLFLIWWEKPEGLSMPSEGYLGCSGCPSSCPACLCRASSWARSCCCCCRCLNKCPCSLCWCRASWCSLSLCASSARLAASLCCSSCSSYGDRNLVSGLAEGCTWGKMSWKYVRAVRSSVFSLHLVLMTNSGGRVCVLTSIRGTVTEH